LGGKKLPGGFSFVAFFRKRFWKAGIEIGPLRLFSGGRLVFFRNREKNSFYREDKRG
jgi:hypothetical protein